jgi:hypothetical protein
VQPERPVHFVSFLLLALPCTSENADAARRFVPLKLAELRDAVLAAGPTLCPNCDDR